MTRRKTPEADAQRAIVQTLRFVLPRGAIVHHSVNEVTSGDRRGKTRQAILVGMGVHSGFADLIVLSEGRVLFLEVKSKTGRLRPAQEDFRDTVQAQGFAWALVRSVDDALAPLLIMGSQPVYDTPSAILTFLPDPGGQHHEPSRNQLGHPATRAETHHPDRALASV